VYPHPVFFRQKSKAEARELPQQAKRDFIPLFIGINGRKTNSYWVWLPNSRIGATGEGGDLNQKRGMRRKIEIREE